jgi:hypothetical protein
MKKHILLFLSVVLDCMNRFIKTYSVQITLGDCVERNCGHEKPLTTYYTPDELFWTIDQFMVQFEVKSQQCIRSRSPQKCSYIAWMSASNSMRRLIRRYYHELQDEKRKYRNVFNAECNLREAYTSTSNFPSTLDGHLESEEISHEKPSHHEKVSTQPKHEDIPPIPSTDNEKKQIPSTLKDSGTTMPANFVVLIVFGAAIPIAVVVGVFWLFKR